MTVAKMIFAIVVAAMGLNDIASAQGATAPRLDPLPHEVHPDSWPQPDYFTQGLTQTRFQPGARWGALKLADDARHATLVMPVQMQAFGMSPAFSAIVGARLDRELAARGVDANRQTDLFDADGPYVRRFGDAETAAFASAQQSSQVLALYIGRDGAGRGFVTLTLRREGRLSTAHRTIDEPVRVLAALDAFSAPLADLLDELKVAARPLAQAQERERRCEADDWSLPDLKRGAPRAARACRAIVIGALLPEFEWESRPYPRPKTADKLPWLAEAWVEADALTPASARAMRTIAWSQLELADAYDSIGEAVDVDDPVLRAVARGLWAWKRARKMPTTDRTGATNDYADAAAAALPPFVRAAFLERARVEDAFRDVDICALETELPALRVPAECGGRPPTERKQAVTRGERALLEGWRVARAFKALFIEGEARGRPARREAVLHAMPARLAAHPLIRLERFRSERFDEMPGSFEALAARAVAATTDFVQTTADLQRSHTGLAHAVNTDRWTTSTVLRNIPAIKAVAADEERLLELLTMNGFASRDDPAPGRGEFAYVNLLGPGPLRRPLLFDTPPVPRAVESGPPSWPPSDYPPGTVFPGALTAAGVLQVLERSPNDLNALTALAILRLKSGWSLAQAVAPIDARPVDRRVGEAVTESHKWSMPAFVFLFAGEVDTAKHYYARVAEIGSYSESDLVAREALRLLAGDVPAALEAARQRLQRYESDYARRDLAGLQFSLGQTQGAWSTLAPRLSTSDRSELWTAVAAGQRMEGKSAKAAYEWAVASSYGHARPGDIDIRLIHALRMMTEDRVPSGDDLAFLATLRKEEPRRDAWAFEDLRAFALLKQLAAAPRVTTDDARGMRGLIAGQTGWRVRGALKPLYGWVVWRASGGKDPSLNDLRSAELTNEFDTLLAKAVVLGLDGKPDEAVRFLRAARYDLAYATLGEIQRDIRSAPYMAAYVAWLLYSQTNDARYRDEALLIARAYGRIFPFLAWAHALDALLSPEGSARATSACRAAYLDKGSQFLALSGLKPDLQSATCRRAMRW